MIADPAGINDCGHTDWIGGDSAVHNSQRGLVGRSHKMRVVQQVRNASQSPEAKRTPRYRITTTKPRPALARLSLRETSSQIRCWMALRYSTPRRKGNSME